MQLDRVRLAGLACMAGAVFWIIALLIEYRYGLLPPGSGTLFTITQSMFAVAMIGYIVGLLGLFWARVVGGWFGRITLALFFLGWCAIFVALAASLLTDSAALELLAPIGGILGNFSALLAGIAVARRAPSCATRARPRRHNQRQPLHR